MRAGAAGRADSAYQSTLRVPIISNASKPNSSSDPTEKVRLYHRIAALWSEKLAKQQNAVGALEKILEIDPGEEKAISVAAVVGYCARAVAFGLVGLFLVRAGWRVRLESAGCRVAKFNTPSWYSLEELNYRPHRKILVVDDSALSRRTLRRILESADYEVAEADDGMAALEMYFLEKPSLVLLDLVMKGMYGLDVLAKLREMDPKALVIVATADIQSSTRKLVDQAGALAFINKPFVPEEVIAAVEAALAEGANS